MTHGKGAARSRETLRRLSRGWAVPVWRAFASGYDSAGMSDVLVGPARPVRRRRPVAGLVTILVVLSLLGLLATRCIPHPVGAARTYGKYESKARTTAKSALSNVATVRLAAQIASKGNAFGPYLSVLISDAEEALIGDLVAGSASGARFKLALAWVVLVGVIGIIVYAEMAGRVAAVSGRPVFSLVRERLGPGFGLANLVASSFINFLTLAAEIAGVAIAMAMVASVHYILLVPVAAFLIWFVVWHIGFERMERMFGITGLALLGFLFALFHYGPDWSHLFSQAAHPGVPKDETIFTYLYFGIALFGSAMTPYEVFFFSSGAVEEHWTEKDLSLDRANVYVGFPLGGLLSLSIMAVAALVFAPLQISVDRLPQVALPAVAVAGKLTLAAVILGIFASTFGAALETGLSAGYC